MRVLVTSGATRERIDRVRFISNLSSGRTGAAVADRLDQEHEVVYLHGKGAWIPKGGFRKIEFTSFQDLDEKLRQTLREEEFSAVVHAAAVSDFSVESVQVGQRTVSPDKLKKIDSLEQLRVFMRRNHKIVDRIREYSLKKDLCLVAFKLTDSPADVDQRNAVQDLETRSGADYVVHNDMETVSRGETQYRIFRHGKVVHESPTRQDLGDFLRETIKEGNA